MLFLKIFIHTTLSCSLYLKALLKVQSPSWTSKRIFFKQIRESCEVSVMQNIYISNYLKLPRIDLLPREVNNADVLSIFLSNNEQTVNQSSSRSNVYERGCYTSGLFNNGFACANSAIFKGKGRVNTNVRQDHLAHLGWYHCIHVLTTKNGWKWKCILLDSGKDKAAGRCWGRYN